MTTLTQDRQPAPSSTLDSSPTESPGPTARLLVSAEPDDKVFIDFVEGFTPHGVDFDANRDIHVTWEPEDTVATLYLELDDALAQCLDAFYVGWPKDQVEKLTGEATQNPIRVEYQASDPKNATGPILELTWTKAEAQTNSQMKNFACYFGFKKNGSSFGHDPKIYNTVPTGGPH